MTRNPRVITDEELDAAGEVAAAVRVCPACGSEYLSTDQADAKHHEALECVGGDERFTN